MKKTTALTTAAALVGGLVLPLVPTADAESGAVTVGTDNMAHVANLTYDIREYDTRYFDTIGDFAYPDAGSEETQRPGGTDLEITTLTDPAGASRDVAVAGSYRNGVHLIDVTDPEQPELITTYDCGVAQGDVQIFSRGDRTFAAYAADDISSHVLGGSACYQEGLAIYGQTIPEDAASGDVDALNADGMYGTFIIDITNPWEPETVQTVGWARQPTGSHNTTVDPSGQFIYNSNQDLVADVPGAESAELYQVEVFEIGDLVPNPDHLSGESPLNFEVTKRDNLALTVNGPHDITFNADGTRAYVAAIAHTVVVDTTDLAHPAKLGEIVDPAITIHHQSDPVTIVDPLTGLDRTFLIISDELGGVIQGAGACPGGLLHVYEITGQLENAPVKVGAFGIAQVTPATQQHLRCTAHVFRTYDNGLATIAWYGAGVRVLDLRGLVGLSLGTEVTGSAPLGIAEVGAIYLPDITDEDGAVVQEGSQTWAAKMHAPRIDPETGAGYIFANDLDRGFDVFHFDGLQDSVLPTGQWMSPAQALEAAADTIAARAAGQQFQSYCLLLRNSA